MVILTIDKITFKSVEGSLKIMFYKDRNLNTKEIIINHKGTRMLKDGED